jgi:hypothetical protein
MSNANRYPKSKRRNMKSFKLEEISVVDKPAQAGAKMAIMKRGGHVVIGVPSMTEEKFANTLASIDRKLDLFLKATEDEYEVYPRGQEFEKAPVPYQGKPHHGDWPPGSDTPGPGKRPPKGTRANDYVSDDESDEHGGEMTPERASQVLRPYADHSVTPEEDEPQTEADELYSRLEDEDEQVGKAVDALALRLAKRFPRASVAAIANTVEGALDGASSSRSGFGREREYAKRAAAQQQPIRKAYSDDSLFDRLQKSFPRVDVERHLMRYR